MRTVAILVVCVQVCLAAVAADPEIKTPPLSPLFDGKSFAGWEGNLQAFRIQDGAIVGGHLDKPVPRNEYLCTTKVYRDFELRLKFRLSGENVNAGVQFRSERVPGSNEIIGYQADMGQHYWGSWERCLEDDPRTGIIVFAITGCKLGESLEGIMNHRVLRFIPLILLWLLAKSFVRRRD